MVGLLVGADYERCDPHTLAKRALTDGDIHCTYLRVIHRDAERAYMELRAAHADVVAARRAARAAAASRWVGWMDG